MAAQQYCSIAEILLALFDPFTPSDQEDVLKHTIQICGLAYTNDSVAARVNAFGPLAFCEYSSRFSMIRTTLLTQSYRWQVPRG